MNAAFQSLGTKAIRNLIFIKFGFLYFSDKLISINLTKLFNHCYNIRGMGYGNSRVSEVITLNDMLHFNSHTQNMIETIL